VARHAGEARLVGGRLVPRVRVAPVVEVAANVDSLSGRKVSHMTASSVVSVDAESLLARPGCGPCGRPEGCSVIEPTEIPLREPKFPET
jgi:hypothetical protein